MENQFKNWKMNLAMLWFSQLLVMAGYSAMIPFIPLFMKEVLHITDEKPLAVAVSMFNFFGTLGYVLFCPVWGKLSDRFGMKPMLLRGTFVTAFIFPFMGYAGSAAMLIFLRFATACCAGTTSASQTMIARTTPDDKQGFAQGVLTTAIWGGAMLGNVVGGLIIHYFSYRYAFWFCGILYFVSGFSILFTHDSAVQSVVKNIKKHRVSLIPQFTRAVWLLLALFFLMGLIRNFEVPYVALKVEQMAGKEGAAYWTGIVSAVVCCSAIFSGVVSGYLSDKLAPRKMLIPVLLVSALALILQGAASSLFLFTAARTLLYLAAGGLQPLLQKILSGSTPANKRGAVFGFSTGAGGSGTMLAAILAGWCFYAVKINGVFYIGGLLFVLALPVFLKFVAIAMKQKDYKSYSSQS